MTRDMIPYLLIYLFGVFSASVSQVLLKKAAMRPHKTIIQEYTDWRVIVGYVIFVGCTFMTLLAYRGIPMSWGPVLETTGYVYVTIFGVTIFKEKLNKKKVIALAIILIGVLLYAL